MPPGVVIEIVAVVQHAELTTKLKDVALMTVKVATAVFPILTTVAPERFVPVTFTVLP